MGTETPFTYWFTIDHVYDGDTIMGSLDMGLAHYLGRTPKPTYSIRLYGINAPELNATDAATRTAAQASRDHLSTLLPAGAYIRVVSMGWDKYAMRIDGVPFTADGVDCCRAMLDAGFAVAYS